MVHSKRSRISFGVFLVQVGFKPHKVLKKRNKALRKIRKLLEKRDSFSTEVALQVLPGIVLLKLVRSLKQLHLSPLGLDRRTCQSAP